LRLRQFGAKALHRGFEPVYFRLMPLRIGDTLVVRLLEPGLKAGDFLAQPVEYGAQAVALDRFTGDLSYRLGRSARLSFARCDCRLPLPSGC